MFVKYNNYEYKDFHIFLELTISQKVSKNKCISIKKKKQQKTTKNNYI